MRLVCIVTVRRMGMSDWQFTGWQAERLMWSTAPHAYNTFLVAHTGGHCHWWWFVCGFLNYTTSFMNLPFLTWNEFRAPWMVLSCAVCQRNRKSCSSNPHYVSFRKAPTEHVLLRRTPSGSGQFIGCTCVIQSCSLVWHTAEPKSWLEASSWQGATQQCDRRPSPNNNKNNRAIFVQIAAGAKQYIIYSYTECRLYRRSEGTWRCGKHASHIMRGLKLAGWRWFIPARSFLCCFPRFLLPWLVGGEWMSAAARLVDRYFSSRKRTFTTENWFFSFGLDSRWCVPKVAVG